MQREHNALFFLTEVCEEGGLHDEPKEHHLQRRYSDHRYRSAVWRSEEGTEKACTKCYPATFIFVTMPGQGTSHLPLPPYPK